jgi:hypothetical protein
MLPVVHIDAFEDKPAFKVPKAAGRTEADVMRQLAAAVADWLDGVL